MTDLVQKQRNAIGQITKRNEELAADKAALRVDVRVQRAVMASALQYIAAGEPDAAAAIIRRCLAEHEARKTPRRNG
jgi:hypothetical protein